MAWGQAAPPPPGGARRAPGGLAGAVRAPPSGSGLRAPSAIGSGRSRGPGRLLPPPPGGLCNACGGARRRRRVPAAASPRPPREAEEGSVSVVLLAGGVGKRMGAAMPKQYLPLRGKPIALHSLAVFEALPEVAEVVVVCDPAYRDLFEAAATTPLKFAEPGAERQDSVSNGLARISAASALVAVHDSARPLVTGGEVQACIGDALEHGAAVLGVPVKPTIKEADGAGFVAKTLQRSLLWEVQTPQIVRPALLRAGFELVAAEGLEVTDDVSVVEALGEPVKITLGRYTNIKVTTPDDMSVAEGFLAEREAAVAA